MKRYRQIKAKRGELKMQFGKVPHEAPDMCTAWGEECSRRDASLLFHHFGSDRPPTLFDKGVWQPSLLKELEKRGYDLKTLKFSIQKIKSPEIKDD